MTINAKAALFLLFAAAISFSACKKDEKSKTEILTSTTCWSPTKQETLDPTTGNWVEDAIENCTKDDCTTFKSDGTLTFDEGATKCDPTDPQTSSGSWSLSADEKSLILTESGTSFSFTIVEINEDKLVLETNIFGFQIRSTLSAK
jgi:hypothetical protein